MRYKISNWQEYQHYKDRCPPWIKLHHSLITSEVWVMGNDASRALSVACMLLASRDNANDGSFNGDPEYIKRFAYLNTKPDFEHLIKHAFIELLQDASTELAECNTEQSRAEQSRESSQASNNLFPDVENRQLVKDWEKIRKAKKLPITETAIKGFLREVEKSGWSLSDVLTKCCEKSWGGFEAKWLEKETKPKHDGTFNLDEFMKGKQ